MIVVIVELLIAGVKVANIWYVSDDGSDNNDCHSESAPCKNLQTVLDRATDGADIYVTSRTFSLQIQETTSGLCQTLDQMTVIVTQNLHHVRTYIRFWTERQMALTSMSLLVHYH